MVGPVAIERVVLLERVGAGLGDAERARGLADAVALRLETGSDGTAVATCSFAMRNHFQLLPPTGGCEVVCDSCTTRPAHGRRDHSRAPGGTSSAAPPGGHERVP